MKRLTNLFIVTFCSLVGIALLSVFSAQANAASGSSTGENSPSVASPQCVSLVRECFEYSGLNRGSCFFSSATHPFCEGSELGSIANRRWMLSPSGANNSTAPALLGSQTVNKECLNKFDSQLQSLLKKPELNHDSLRQLASSLEDCKRNLDLELQRP